MTERIRRRILAGVVVATLLIALNVAALVLGWNHPEVTTPAIVLDLGGLALVFWLAWRQSLLVASVYEIRAAELKQETVRVQATLDDTEARPLGRWRVAPEVAGQLPERFAPLASGYQSGTLVAGSS